MSEILIKQTLPYLVVDSSHSQRQALCKLLYTVGITEIIQAESGQEALQFLNSTKFEMIISELKMRDYDGYELLQKVRRSDRYGELPFVIVYPKLAATLDLEAAQMIANASIVRPLSSDKITRAIINIQEQKKKKVNLNLNILIVDDVSSARKVAKRYLNQLGFHNLKEAKSAKDALLSIEKNEVNLVLADWCMPEMDGIELIKILKKGKTTKSIPVIMVSSFSDKKRILEAAEAGAVSFISKPYCSELLYERIAEALPDRKTATKTKMPQSDTQ